jgi:2C-methyl-D-erythritol 2,4-cyclodiphosphate synthase
MHIGRRPLAAFGNSDGDPQMLEWTTAGSGTRFALIVHHTDAEREWDYDRTSLIGRLDKAWDEAKAKNWTVVEMKQELEARVSIRTVGTGISTTGGMHLPCAF